MRTVEEIRRVIEVKTGLISLLEKNLVEVTEYHAHEPDFVNEVIASAGKDIARLKRQKDDLYLELLRATKINKNT